MSQHTQHRQSDWPRTLHGFGHLEESPPPGHAWEPRFVPVGPRIGRSGQVFETNDGLVVKLLTWGAGLPDQVVLDFTRDAMTVANLRHPHVAQVFDAGVLGDGTPFVVMERLAGLTLEEVDDDRSLSFAEVLPILRGVGAALGAAHAAGIAHGEVRAENVFLAIAGSGPPCPKLLDFGVARLLAEARANGRSLGRPAPPAAVMPRLELGRRAAERADQLGLATLAWRLLGGMCAPAVQRVLLRAMSPDPSQRFGSVAALVDAIEEAAVSAAPTGWARSAGAVRTLAGAAAPLPPARFVVAAAPMGNAAVAHPGSGGPAPASPAPSLTQEFFAAGEQLEAAHAAGHTSDASTAKDADDEDVDEMAKTVAARVPRSRAQMTLAALLALGSVAVIGWTVALLAAKPAGGAGAAASPAVVPSPAVTATPSSPAINARNPRAATAAARRAARVQPPPFAPASKPAVAAAAPRAAAPPIPPPLPPVEAPRAASHSTAQPSPVAAAQSAVAAPAPAAPAAEATPRPNDRADDQAASAATNDDDPTNRAEKTGGERRADAPAASAPDEAAPTAAPAP